tara:strand:+ start:711 stop:1382 length:672 start_codon:yes stop_codon:yes gene_type:complete
MNKLWIFGDSFAHGGGCHFDPVLGEKYLKYYQNYPIDYKTENDVSGGWAKHASIELDLPLEQCALGGHNWEETYIHLISYLPSFKKGDYIIFNIPYEIRTKDFSPITGEEINIFEHIKSSTEGIEGVVSKEDVKIWVDYYHTFHHANAGKGWDNHVKGIAKKLSNTLNDLGYKVIYWAMSDHCENYETISKHTKEKIKDLHWSFKGNKDFYEEIIKPQLNDIK